MTEQLVADDSARVSSWSSGSRAKGEFVCLECGYGIVVSEQLPACPMCRSDAWEVAQWRPFSRHRHSAA